MREKFRKRDSPPPTPKTTSDKYPDFVQSTRYGYVDGLCGANCRHSFYPYIEGVSHNPFEQFDSEENKNDTRQNRNNGRWNGQSARANGSAKG